MEARITLPLEQLKALPEGLKVSERQQHTTVTVSRKGDTLLFSARSDSVMDQCTTNHMTTAKKEGNMVGRETPAFGNILIIVAIFLLFLIIAKYLLTRLF